MAFAEAEKHFSLVLSKFHAFLGKESRAFESPMDLIHPHSFRVRSSFERHIGLFTAGNAGGDVDGITRMPVG